MRFVIQHHICEDEHYDLMIENGDALSTWKISSNDFEALLDGKKIKAKKIQDHRKEYLTYEGAVSGGRGYVEIFDSGDCELISEKKEGRNTCRYQMKGSVFIKIIRFKKIDDFYRIEVAI